VPPSPEIQHQLRAFGANLRRERTARGITQERAAERAELNLRTLQRIEAGETNILLTTVARLRGAIGCRWAELLGADAPLADEVKPAKAITHRRSKS
jgi:transcriptional regulator with XRE-family HTH domain